MANKPLTVPQRKKLETSKQSGSAYSKLVIYGKVDLGGASFEVSVAKALAAELVGATLALRPAATLAKIVAREATKKGLSADEHELMCAGVAYVCNELGLERVPANQVPGAIALAKALQLLATRHGLSPECGQGAVAGLVYVWLRGKAKPKPIAQIFEALAPAEITDGILAFRLARYAACRRDKARMLEWLRLALRYAGNAVEPDDPDFKPYLRDAAFKRVVADFQAHAIASYR